MVVNKLIVDCLLGEDNLIANEVIINYKHRCVFINGNEILFTLTQGRQITILVAMDPPALNRYLWLLTNLL